MKKLTQNKHNCSPKIWNKFSEQSRVVWNDLYETFHNEDNYGHLKISKEELHVASHNLACLATLYYESHERKEKS